MIGPHTGGMRLGVLGVDSSHLPEFTRRIAGLNEAGATRCRVVSMFDAGDHQLPAADVAGWVAEAKAMGVQERGSVEELLGGVDGVLVLAVAGGRHLELAEPALQRGLPTYVDKPLACTAADARRLAALAEEHAAPCYSASSLRFAAEPVAAAADASLGDIVAVDAFGPGELLDANPGVLHYGVHAVEMVDAVLGPGVAEVAAESTADRDLVRLRYADGRAATLRLERRGSYDFGAAVHGTAGASFFKVDFATVYDRLVEAMVGFFRGGQAPVPLSRIVENVAVMEAANRSRETGGGWVKPDGAP
ncbi:Gfo/Idh/MocA family oxidoreductase [Phycisphaera mikurensis]|uniref:Gfo/Idh/MocA-like oxidoreductase N-terminal domain-containing protein n=1 Tax=Phycisphaera mikurensis (strain NBRC 102666 / KCTC 22515 / FYK2301M01) TaxID=1142394 RepID=I0IDW4_PHYMF|nr:Gfo/Idh/MocA family oxidoreductase [Phycisphaera mikurensis]MBB6441259.1 putative dehydrogenase [Phycisphaera mikurensis]BAM03452.1 hypothetical protein PSMK_12930 [Phycisphaera mikurensis NBRC 102666]